jgi:hypothetical protein
MLRTLRQVDVVTFYAEHAVDVHSRRKLTVRVEGHKKAADVAPAAEGTTSAPPAAAAAPGASPSAAEGGAKGQGEGAPVEEPPLPEVELIDDIYAWKRQQALYASIV